MRTISVIVTGIFLFLSGISVYAQQQPASTIEPYHLAIAYSKTTNIIFPYAILSVDRGSKDVLAQKAKGVGNILQVKAAKEGFVQTNLTVVTADGKLSSFVVDYASQPSVLNLSLAAEKKQHAIATPSENINQQVIQECAKQVFASERKVRGGRDKSFGVRLKLDGIFIKDELMYLRLNIANATHINYGIDQLRLYIRDQKKAKRTATQELEIIPVLAHNNTDYIKGHSEHTIVMAVPKFTIPDKKYLALQLMEKNGGRHLEVHVKNRTLVKAIPIE